MSPGIAIAWGLVRHTRFFPKEHSFQYRSAFLYLPMHTLALRHRGFGWAVNHLGLVSFHDCDHGDGRGPEAGGALAWLHALLEEAKLPACDEIYLQTLPRIFGYAFKPVSFWYAYHQGQLTAIVAEVNNTFGERHIYLLKDPQFGRDLIAQKVFFVSPFNPVLGTYRFRFLKTKSTPERLVARVDYEDEGRPLLSTSWSGTLTPFDRRALIKLIVGYPGMTLAIILRIHWNAFRLLLKGVPLQKKPKPPREFVSHL